MISSEYRHVCFKDLNRFFIKDKYFSDLTEEEKNKIKENLDISDATSIIEGTYEELEKLVNTGKLLQGLKYLLTDFQTIYSLGYEVMGTEDSRFPSHTYAILLTAIGVNIFDPRVILLSEDSSSSHVWEVRYNFNKSRLVGGAYNKGEITYLKDEFYNSAHFDFKNIRVLFDDEYYYTFDDNGEDASSKGLVTNVNLDFGCVNNIFTGESYNIKLESECSNNHFMGEWQQDCHLFSDSVNNLVTTPFLNTAGKMTDLVIDDDLFSTYEITKTITLSGLNHTVMYLDLDTLTMQYLKL